MASVCISNCVKDTLDQVRVPPVRATYRNLYKWPESDAEFVRSVTANMRRGAEGGPAASRHPRVVDSISCRQMYLRSYTFTRKEDQVEEDDGDEKRRAAKCLGKTGGRRRKKKKEQVGGDQGAKRSRKKSKKYCLIMRNAIFRFFRTLLACSATVDVVLGDPTLV